MNNPPLASCDVPEGSFWISSRKKVIVVCRKSIEFSESNTQIVFEISELGSKPRIIPAALFIEQAALGKIKLVSNNSTLTEQLSNERT